MDGIRPDDFAGLLAALGRGAPAVGGVAASPATSASVMGPAAAAANPTVMMPPRPHTQFMWQPPTALPPPPSLPPQFAIPPQPAIDPYAMMAAAAQFQQQQQLQQQAAALSAAAQAATPTAPARAGGGGGGGGTWLLAILLAAVISFGVLAWMRSARMRAAEDEDVEEEEGITTANAAYKAAARAEVRELPPPSAVSEYLEGHGGTAAVADVASTVHDNLLRYVGGGGDGIEAGGDVYAPYSSMAPPLPLARAPAQHIATHRQDVVDISGFDLPLEIPLPPPPSKASSASSSAAMAATSSAPMKRLNADDAEEVNAYARRRDALFDDATPPM